MQSCNAIPEQSLWRTLRHFWCRHTDTVTTPKTDTMPAHVVCRSCGWREPVIASAPIATRTWDSTRDELRYQREKKRRAAVEERKQIAQSTMPGLRSVTPRRRRRSNVVDMKRVG